MTVKAADKKALGLWMATALVVGNMIGSGVFLLPASLAPYGGISLFGWLFTAAGAILLALVFARLSRMVPNAGGPYAYTRAGFGDFAGFLIAWGYWIAIWVGNASIATAFVGYLGVFWPPLATQPVLSIAAALIAVWFLTWVNALGVRNAGVLQLVTTLLKLIPLVAIAAVGLQYLNLAAFTPFNATLASANPQSNFAAITAVATLTLWSFIGLESATVPAGDVQNPERIIPWSTVLGTLVTALVYILSTTAVMGLIPAAALVKSTAPFADAARAVWGDWAGYAVAVGAAVSCFGALNGWILLQGQVPLAAARDKLFPQRFATVSADGTPVFGLVLSSVLITALMAMNYTKGLVEIFNFTILLATLTTLVPYLFSAMAELLVFISERERFHGKRFVGSTLIAALAFLYALWAIAGSGRDTVYWGFILLMAGIPVYVWLKWSDGKARPAVAH
ncbi:MAG: amino acid permease [Gammaproteobacteria bacterium]